MTAPVHKRHTIGASADIEVIEAIEPDDRLAVLDIRRRVFGEEQHVADLRVADADDSRSLIALALLHSDDPDGRQRRPVSTGRLTVVYGVPTMAQIAWVATVPEARRLGVGTEVMRFLLDAADAAGIIEVALAAQWPAIPFYSRLGFAPAGSPYDVRGILHRRMTRRR
jgi:predicted GNAT family N-acyltransferase